MNFKSENEVLYKKHLCYTYFKRKKIKQLSLIINWIREGDKYQPSTLLSDGNFIVDVFKKIKKCLFFALYISACDNAFLRWECRMIQIL